MVSAVIVDTVRTPIGRRNGAFAATHPVEMAAHTLRALVSRNDLDPGVVDDVIMGCVIQNGEQSGNIARWSSLAAGLPEAVPGTTVDRQCGSSQQAVHFAAQGVIAGAYDVVIAAGVEHMSSLFPRPGDTPAGAQFSGPIRARYAPQGGLVHQGVSAELIAEKWSISREMSDELSLESHQRATRAIDEGRFEREIVPMAVGGEDGAHQTVAVDEGVRRDTTIDRLAQLRPAFRDGGTVTAGNASQISDGAAAVLIMSEERAERLGLRARARFHTFALAGVDPIVMLTGPIPATTKALERAKLTLDDLDVVEINEAFASVVLAWAAEHHPDMAKVNVNGGAIALGHPLGCSGARLLSTLVCELERTGGRYGLQTMCEGGGMANATIIERL